MMLLPPGRVHISEAAVDAAHGLPVIQVNVDLGVTQGATAAVTRDLGKLDRLRPCEYIHSFTFHFCAQNEFFSGTPIPLRASGKTLCSMK